MALTRCMAAIAPAWLVLCCAFLCASLARADDTLKVAIGQMEAWAQQPPILGQQAGIFKKHGIVLENFGTQGAGETLQTVDDRRHAGVQQGRAGAHFRRQLHRTG